MCVPTPEAEPRTRAPTFAWWGPGRRAFGPCSVAPGDREPHSAAGWGLGGRSRADGAGRERARAPPARHTAVSVVGLGARVPSPGE